MGEKTKKIISLLLFTVMLGYYFVLPFQIKKADAFMGIADITFTTIAVDIPEKIIQLGEKLLKAGLRKLKKRLMAQMQNELVNYVQGGGRPRFITNPMDFLRGAADTAAVTALDEVFGTGPNAIDVCSPFKMNVELLVRKIAIPEAQDANARCTLGDIKNNLVKFGEDFTSYGGWNSWIELHEAENTLPGAYWGIYSKVSSNITRSENAAQQEAISGSGFLNQKICHELSVNSYKGRTALELKFGIQSSNPDLETAVGDLAGINFAPEQLTSAQLLDAINLAITQGIEEPMVPLSDGTKKPFLQAFDPIEGSRTTIGSELLGEGITMDKIPQSSIWDAKCTDEETITPGSTASEWVSGGLRKLGIDWAADSDDIMSLISAVVNAATNRAMSEGLSLVKSGMGVLTKPSTIKKNRQVETQTQTEGQESTSAVTIQNQISDVLNKAERLERDLKKLGEKDQKKEDKFNERILRIAGIGYNNLRTSVITSMPDKKLSDVIYRLYGKYNDKYLKENKNKINFSDKSNFNEEANVPGLYFANQALYKKMSDLWYEIAARFATLSTVSNYGGKNQCTQVKYTLEPAIITAKNGNQIDCLPFIVDGVSNIQWPILSGYVGALNETIKDEESTYYSLDDPLESFTNYAKIQSTQATSKATAYRQLAESYRPLIENASGITGNLEEDRKFIIANMDKVILMTSLLLDYDKAGAGQIQTGTNASGEPIFEPIELVKKIKLYNSAMGSNTATDDKVETAYGDLLIAQIYARERWKKDTTDATKSKSIEKTIQLINQELQKINLPDNVAKVLINFGYKPILPLCKKTRDPTGHKEILAEGEVPGATCTQSYEESSERENKVINYMQTGLGLFNAVTQAIDIDIESLTSELDERQNKISTMQTDISNQLGESIIDVETRKQAGLEGGDTEWEKYYKNRTQLVYLSFIKDFYVNWFVQKNFCNNNGEYVPDDPPIDTDDVEDSVSNLPESIKIMAVGDSNTQGYVSNTEMYATSNSYRQKLSELLSSDTTVNYLGSSGSGSLAHEGFGGYKISNIAPTIGSKISTYKPEIVLLMIGSNDMWVSLADRTQITPTRANAVVNEMTGLVNSIKVAGPAGMKIIIAKPITPTDTPTALEIFRRGIDTIDANNTSVSTIDASGCTNDGVHFDAAGYTCLAEKWAAGIKALYSE